ncbi:MAG: hypothetical protein AUG48_05825 [Actinobacteria bacterium 13_1_20CM_3_68_9]|nr:MAG: hypothetical protein AUG48_05825 [Actinobacteria bacterium 13_1_20CM_3_68_9]
MPPLGGAAVVVGVVGVVTVGAVVVVTAGAVVVVLAPLGAWLAFAQSLKPYCWAAPWALDKAALAWASAEVVSPP